MVDTQADISLIKLNNINDFNKIHTNDIIKINGITQDTISTIGTINTKLIIANFELFQKLHVVSDNFNIPSDGILGKDFLKKFQCQINYDSMTMNIHTNNKTLVIDILGSTQPNTVAIPARCEVMRFFNFDYVGKPLLVDSQDLSDGVLVARGIVDSKRSLIKIINTTDEVKVVKNYGLKIENLENYKILTINDVVSNIKRTKSLLNILSSRMPKFIQSDLLPICEEFSDIFSLETDMATVNNFYTQKLRLDDKNPVYVKNYRLPYTQKTEIDRQVNNLLKNNLIEPSQSNFNSPLILVPKKGQNKKWRMCVDYRLVNKKLIADKFPLPRIDDILDGLGRAKYFSIVDLFSGFHQIPLDEDSRNVTSFSTSSGAYRWKVLPFGLNIAPNSFSRMMSIAFTGISPEQAFLYIDDIIIIGASESHHLKNIKDIFQVFRKHNLKLNPNKCDFFRSEVTFLGHKCTSNGLLPDDSKIHAIKNYTRPNDKDSVRRFVAFSNYYRRFIPNFASLSAPLNNLTRKNVIFNWDDICENAFNSLRSALTAPKLLQYPNFQKPFIITVDASKIGCGAVLSQMNNGNDLPVHFASKSFSIAEKKKPIIELELLAIYFAIKTFRPYVYGTEFTVRTDHRPLIYLFNIKDPSSKLTRIRLELSEYNFTIEYIKGTKNVAADALSRISFEEIKTINSSNLSESLINYKILAITRSMLKNQNEILSDNSTQIKNYDREEYLVKIYEELNVGEYSAKIPRIFTKNMNNNLKPLLNIYIKSKKICEIDMSKMIVNEKFNLGQILSRLEIEANIHKIYKIQWPLDDEIFTLFTINEMKNAVYKSIKNLQIILIKRPKTIKDDIEKLELLKLYHNDLLIGGHCGQKKLAAKLRNQFYWKGMTRDVAKYVKNCTQCQLNKVKPKTRQPLVITPTPQKAFDIVIMDTIGPLQSSNNGNKYVVTIICDLTKYLITIPIPNKEAKTVARAIFNNFILIYGTMIQIRTDLGTEYKNETVMELFKLLGIDHKFSTAYHHQTLGTIERNHRVLNEYLRAYLNENVSDWDEYLKYFTFCYNISNNSALNDKFSPYELIFAKKVNLPKQLFSETIDPLYNIDDYAKEIKYRLQITHNKAQKLLINNKLRNKIQYDKKSRPLNLSINDTVLLKNEPYDKLKSIYSGPFKVKHIDEGNATISNEISEKIVHKNRLVKLEI